MGVAGGDEKIERWRRRRPRVGRGALGDLGGLRGALGRSLATFQLGESGTGEHLFAAAEQAGASADLQAALRLFVGEEQEHARLLALVLDGLGANATGATACSCASDAPTPCAARS